MNNGKRGHIGAPEIWQWAKDVHEESEAADRVVADIIKILTALPHDVVIQEDCEVFLDALANPLEDADLSLNLLWNYFDMLDEGTRKRALLDDPFYGPYCKDVL